MNKTELVQAIAEKANLNKTQAKAALEAMLCSVGCALKDGKKVALIGFGTFQTIQKDPREGINPMTKEKIQIAAKMVVKFRAGAELIDMVNK